jgi:hypothetical protein
MDTRIITMIMTTTGTHTGMGTIMTTTTAGIESNQR